MHSSSLVDSLMDRMEDYSCHLEDLVEERTIQYKKEKERADGLLYRMLPKCVADDMKATAANSFTLTFLIFHKKNRLLSKKQLFFYKQF